MQFSSFDIKTIENFISGKTSPEVTSQIEHLIKTNSEFKSEINLQKDIIEGLQEKRVTELKTRLVNLKPLPDFTRIFRLTATGIAATAVTTLGVFTFYNQNKTLSVSPSYINNHTYALANEQIINQKSIILLKNDLVTSNITPIEREKSNEVIENIVLESIDAANPEIKSPNNPLFNAEEDDLISFSNETNVSNTQERKSIKSETNVAVNISYSESKFAYIFDGENLTLVGDFDKNTPYTVYELNFNKKMFFIHYQSNYYHLKKSASLRKFKKVTDKATIEKLDNLNK